MNLQIFSAAGSLKTMDTFTIITVIAIILFARLGIRLLFGWIKVNKKNGDEKGE